MLRSTQRIITTHTGSLPRPAGVVEQLLAEKKGDAAFKAFNEAFKAKTIIVNKRSMASGYAGLDNELFYLDKTMMVFGDAKKVVDSILKNL